MYTYLTIVHMCLGILYTIVGECMYHEKLSYIIMANT